MFRKTVLVLVLLPLCAFADEYPASITLNSIIPPDQQVTLGLAEQTPEQREALRRLVIDLYRTAYTEGQKSGAQIATQAQRSNSSAVVESQIDGEFKG